MVTLGFVGVEAFDFILFLAKTLSNLGQKVLIVDVNHTNDLSIAMGEPMGIHDKNDIVLLQGIYYIQRIPTAEELKEFQKGIIMVSMGWKNPMSYPWEFHTLFIVLNNYLHILKQFLDMKTKGEIATEMNRMMNERGMKITHYRFILRDLTGLEDRKQLCQILQTKEESMYFISYDMMDREIALSCQQNRQIKLRKLSYDMKEWIQEVILEILENIKLREVKEAMKFNRKRYIHE